MNSYQIQLDSEAAEKAAVDSSVRRAAYDEQLEKASQMSVGESDLAMPKVSASHAPAQSTPAWFDGDKFPGGFGPTQLFTTDYWTLRKRSAQLFKENLYARGMIRRLITNEINTGLTPAVGPEESIIGVPEDSLDGWTESVENRFAIWGRSATVCDYRESRTFGELQRSGRREAFVEGDILAVLRLSKLTGSPQVDFVAGELVRTPFGGGKPRAGNTIKHGVERDSKKRHVAFWVTQDDGTSKRLPAFGEKTGRKVAWLIYGTDKRMDEVRGEPILSLVLQSLKEIDRYRDSTQRKAVINSILAMFIKKDQDKMSTLPMSGGAKYNSTTSVTDSDGGTRNFNIASQVPGMVIQELNTGETPEAFGSQGTDVNFGTFEQSIIQAVAWANEIPPEILTLAFSNNYSASQAAINEFKIYLNLVWTKFGEDFCTPIYVEWLISETLQNRISSPRLLQAWRDPARWDVFGAWVWVDWYGSIKPSTDVLKQVKGAKMAIEQGLSTHTREARGLTGSSFSKNIKRIKKENSLMVDARRPLAEFKQEFGEDIDESEANLNTLIEANLAGMLEASEEGNIVE